MAGVMCSTRRGTGRRAAPALLLLLLLLAAAPHTVAPVAADVFAQRVTRYFSITDQSSAATSVDAANTACMAQGGSLIADYSAAVTTQIGALCTAAKGSSASTLCTTFLDGSAKPPADNQLQCIENSRLELYPTAPNSEHCYYRWRYGNFDSVAFEDTKALPGYFMPGACYYIYLFRFLSGATQTWNGYTYSPWNASTVFYAYGYPHGYFQTIGGSAGAAATYQRMDSEVPAVENAPNPLSSYYIACYVQDTILPDPTNSTKTPQPDVYAGWSTPWAQRYWYVVFIIIAVVLMVLLIIMMYCCTQKIRRDRAGRKQKDLIANSMIMRERDAKAYVVQNEEVDPVESDDVEKDIGFVSTGTAEMQPPLHPYPVYPPYAGEVPVDPEAFLQATPLVFDQQETRMTTDGDSFAADQYNDEDLEDEEEEDLEDDEGAASHSSRGSHGLLEDSRTTSNVSTLLAEAPH